MPDKFSYVKRGYDPAAVDQHIEQLEAEIKSYKDKDGLINQAIVSAQEAAGGIVQNAKNQARQIREKTSKQLEDIRMSTETQRNMLTNFEYEYNTVVEKYLITAKSSDFKAARAKIDEMESFLRKYSEELDEDLSVENKASDKNPKK